MWKLRPMGIKWILPSGRRTGLPAVIQALNMWPLALSLFQSDHGHKMIWEPSFWNVRVVISGGFSNKMTPLTQSLPVFGTLSLTLCRKFTFTYYVKEAVMTKWTVPVFPSEGYLLHKPCALRYSHDQSRARSLSFTHGPGDWWFHSGTSSSSSATSRKCQICRA